MKLPIKETIVSVFVTVAYKPACSIVAIYAYCQDLYTIFMLALEITKRVTIVDTP